MSDQVGNQNVGFLMTRLKYMWLNLHDQTEEMVLPVEREYLGFKHNPNIRCMETVSNEGILHLSGNFNDI